MPDPQPHARWVRATHWLAAISIVVLAFTGIVILMAHPRLYWGEVGNDLTPALLELPISRNYKHGGWDAPRPFTGSDGVGRVSASRTYDIFNKNGWGRSLHFVGAWLLVGTGLVYLVIGARSGHFRRALIPASGEITTRHVARELTDHLRLRIRTATGGPQYGLLQKTAYSAIIFVVLPLTGLTGLTMSPAITASFPLLLTLFGGVQSARTIHFALWVMLMLFLAAHVLMVVLSGFRRQLRAMTVGD